MTPSVEVLTKHPDDWPNRVFDVLKRGEIRLVGYVPDAGHTRLINRCHNDPEIEDVVLTTEEEGIGLAAGAWLGGRRSVLLMQSSGVGNCINAFSLQMIGRFPLVVLVTMRGEYAEFNPGRSRWGHHRSKPTTLQLPGLSRERSR